VKKTAIAGARQVLSLADPVRLCETEAIGYLMLHKDSERFPREEALISEYWDRFIVPLLAFPMNGYIAWGCYPDRSYGEAGGKTMSSFHALSNLREYGVRREPWRHYARSGERRYYDYGHRFSRFTGDWCLAHCDVPGSPAKQKGGFITSPGGSGVSGMLPLFWGDRTDKWDINAGDIGHWLLDYYLTGDEHSLDLLYMIKEAFKKGGWRPKGAPNQFHATGIRTLLTLFIMDWDEDSGKTIKEIVNEMVDLKSQNGFRLFESAYGSMYKDERTSHNVLEYYMETGDELAKEAFLKLLNQLYRFDRRGTTVSYKNYDGFTNSIAYWMTGDERYRTVVEQSVRDALYYSELLPLSADLAMKPKNPLDWPNLYVPGEFPGPRRTFFMGHHEYHNPFIGLPTALKLLAEKGWSGKTTPLVVKPMKVIPGEVIFYHERGSETQLNTYVRTGLKMNPETLRIFPYPQSTATLPVEGIKAAVEKRMSRGPWFDANPDAYPDPHEHYNIIITIPAETDTGLYLLSFGENETFTVLDSTSGKVALYCPEGFWSVSIGDHSGSGPYGRSGEGIPAYFRVPDGLKELEIFLGRSARVIAPDGSAVVEFSNKNIGNIKIPVEGKNGIWKIQFYIDSFHGTCPPVFIKMLNIEPIVAFGSPSLLPEGTTGKPVKIPQVQLPAPSASLEFVPGVSGKAVRLSNGQTLAFSEGAALDTGGHTFFPGMKGTAEFWFRADRCTHETPMEMTQYKIQSFLKAPHLNFRHFCEVRSSSRTFDSNLRFELLLSKPAYPPPGFHGQHFFKAGEWTHIAYTWEVKKGKKMEGELNIFVNGHKLLPAQGYSQVRKLAGSAEFELSGEGENIEIGPFDGSMDMLRISDTVKYTEDFVPLKSYGLDDDTRAVFYFDGNLKGISALSKEPVEAK